MAALTPVEKHKLSGLRFRWGGVCAIGWIVLWYWFLSAHLYHWLAVILTFGAVITAPIGFIFGHFIARSLVERERAQIKVNAELTAAAAAEGERESRAQRLAATAASDRQMRLKNARAEIIQKLGSVTDYLDLLPRTADSERSLLIAQNAKREMRELVAKYPLEDLTALIAGDEVIQLKIDSITKRIGVHGIASDDAQVLQQCANARMKTVKASANPHRESKFA